MATITLRVFLYASPIMYGALRVVKYLYSKYMPGVIVNILGHGATPSGVPFDHNFMFISLGQCLADSDMWSIDISNFIRELKNEPYFIFSLADFLLIDMVNFVALQRCVDYLMGTKQQISSIRLASVVITTEILTDMIVYKDDDIFLYTNRIGRSSHKFSLWKTNEFIKTFSLPFSMENMVMYGVLSNLSLVCYTMDTSKLHLREVIPSTVHSVSITDKKFSVLGLKNEDLDMIIQKNLANIDSLVLTYRKTDRNEIPLSMLYTPIFKEDLVKHGINHVTWTRYNDVYPNTENVEKNIKENIYGVYLDIF